MSTAIIYHEIRPGVPCADGIAAAWVAKKKYPKADLIGASYGRSFDIDPSQYDRLFIVDFSFPREILEKWNEITPVTVIDHHKTAMQDLQGFSGAIFDMTESGATLAWQYFFPDDVMPPFLEYVKDRDLWNFDLPYSEDVNEAMGFIGRELSKLDFLASLSQQQILNAIAPLGTLLLRPKRQRIAEIAINAEIRCIKGYSAICVEIPDNAGKLTSDICAHLYRGHDADFALGYSWDKAEKVWKLAFRSDRKGNNFDVSEIARKFGGGGHWNAAGGSAESIEDVFDN